ncbi:MAG: hypothetical protein RAO92_07510 [Candidatus Euphemobacter frigidus]|nr:hypothetical protein [Candidatus Euphemobacter frigidus]MDP8276233.1 hypothetical protein [Candidatus Euphemobacter frigidus]
MMKQIYYAIFFAMAGIIALTGSGFSSPWTAAKRPGRARRAAPGKDMTVQRAIPVQTVTAAAAGTQVRAFRCRPASLIRRPRRRRTSTKLVFSPPEIIVEVKEITLKREVAALPPPIVPVPSPELGVKVEDVLIKPAVAAQPPPPPAPPKAAGKKTVSSYGKIPPYFIRNDGQVDQVVEYYVKGPRGTVYLTGNEVVFDFLQESPPEEDQEAEEEAEEEFSPPGRDREEKKSYTRLVFRRQFKDANPDVLIDGTTELPGKINYFIGSKSNWHANIPTVEEVVYHDLYEGIDARCYFEGANLKHAYTVKPGADPTRLIFQYVGIDGLELKESGDLAVLTPFGGFVTRVPRFYQEIDGKRVDREGSFKLLDETTVTYDIGSYDKQYPLTIE